MILIKLVGVLLCLFFNMKIIGKTKKGQEGNFVYERSKELCFPNSLFEIFLATSRGYKNPPVEVMDWTAKPEKVGDKKLSGLMISRENWGCIEWGWLRIKTNGMNWERPVFSNDSKEAESVAFLKYFILA